MDNKSPLSYISFASIIGEVELLSGDEVTSSRSNIRSWECWVVLETSDALHVFPSPYETTYLNFVEVTIDVRVAVVNLPGSVVISLD